MSKVRQHDRRVPSGGKTEVVEHIRGKRFFLRTKTTEQWRQGKWEKIYRLSEGVCDAHHDASSVEQLEDRVTSTWDGYDGYDYMGLYNDTGSPVSFLPKHIDTVKKYFEIVGETFDKEAAQLRWRRKDAVNQLAEARYRLQHDSDLLSSEKYLKEIETLKASLAETEKEMIQKGYMSRSEGS